MKPYYQDKWVTIYHGDCRDLTFEGISAVVTDPPYELGFMGKTWDSKGISFQKETWEHLRQSCLSGSPLLSFGGTRTFHRIACAIEDAGWEIRDCIMYVYGQGFPKSLDISKAIDKQQGIDREDKFEGAFERHAGPTGNKRCDKCGKWLVSGSPCQCPRPQDMPQSPEAQLWEGYGTALKPAYEPIILAMNPLDGTFANNALKHGVAGLNIDECRVGYPDGDDALEKGLKRAESPRADIRGGGFHTGTDWAEKRNIVASGMTSKGRFPANFIHDGSQMVLELFPESKGAFAPVKRGQNGKSKGIYGDYAEKGDDGATYYGDNGSAARFFYCAKASKAERNKGCGDLEPEQMDESRKEGNPGGDNPRNRGVHKVNNNHPTVKPLALMEYLVKLIKMPEYNLVIDPFMGSGTTLLACIRLGIPCIGIDNDEHTCEIAARRCSQEVMDFSEVK